MLEESGRERERTAEISRFEYAVIQQQSNGSFKVGVSPGSRDSSTPPKCLRTLLHDLSDKGAENVHMNAELRILSSSELQLRRKGLPSLRNFQLQWTEPSVAGFLQLFHQTQSSDQNVLEFVKVERDRFAIKYNAEIFELEQAFAICLSRFY